MGERPILFSAPMVRALLSGAKTQTRRVVKPQPQILGDRTMFQGAMILDEAALRTTFCPFGAPGDRLWVRETWAPHEPRTPNQPRVHYRADHPDWTTGDGGDIERWRPSIYLPRWASRITLEVTGVRVERLQAISEEDAKAEGVERFGDGTFHNYLCKLEQPCEDEFCPASEARESFRSLWESINGADSWALNPWVWALMFKRVTP